MSSPLQDSVVKNLKIVDVIPEWRLNTAEFCEMRTDV
jgi:hypothetical protein